MYDRHRGGTTGSFRVKFSCTLTDHHSPTSIMTCESWSVSYGDFHRKNLTNRQHHQTDSGRQLRNAGFAILLNAQRQPLFSPHYLSGLLPRPSTRYSLRATCEDLRNALVRPRLHPTQLKAKLRISPSMRRSVTHRFVLPILAHTN